MKLQIFILAFGIAISAGAVGAEVHRAASVSTVSQVVGTQAAVTQPSLKQAAKAGPKVAVSTVRPAIKGGSGDD